MKFHWFHLMPYPYLPDNFKEENRSVWVDVPSSLYDPAKGHQVYSDYLDELEYADAAGFDGICVNEHHQNGYGLMPSPNLMAATLTRRTSRAKIIVLGNSVVNYNPPTRVAEEFAMLDVLSGGRLVAGFPVGSAMDTVFCYGQNPVTLREKYQESVDLVLRAWKEPDPFAFNGKYTQLRYVNVWPRPIQKPTPPVWIPGAGSVETWDWCARNDFLYAYLSYYGYKAGQAVMQGYWEAVDKAGKEVNPYRGGFLQFVAVAKDDAEAERLYSEAALYFYERCLHVYVGFAAPPGYTSMNTIRKGITSQIVEATKRAREKLTWRDIVDRGYVLAGDPETVAQKINEMQDTMRAGHLMVLCHFGNMSKEVVNYNTGLFAKEVIPKLRDRFSEYEDHWWPKDTLPELATPAPVHDAR